MARAIYSTRFIASSGLSGTASYTVPPGFVAVIRSWTIFHGVELSGIEATLQGPNPVKIAVYQDVGASAASDEWTGRTVLYAGESMSVTVEAGNVDTTVSGYLLTA